MTFLRVLRSKTEHPEIGQSPLLLTNITGSIGNSTGLDDAEKFVVTQINCSRFFHLAC